MVRTQDVRPMRAPAFISRNSANVTKDSVVTYLCSPKGEIELAPDGRLNQAQLDKIGYKGWRRCEANGVREIEKLSIILSKQEFEKKKSMKVQQFLREIDSVKQRKVAARLRIAQQYSKNDVEANQIILKRAEQQEEAMYKFLSTEFDPASRTTGLQMEMKDQSTSRLANVGQKTTGIA